MPSSVTSRPAPLACGECRQQHLKCDGAKPTCARCNTKGLLCQYSPSRRGYGRQREQGRRSVARRETPLELLSHPPTPSSFSSAHTGEAFLEPALPPVDALSTPSNPLDTVQTVGCSSTVSVEFSQGTIDKEPLLNAYYIHFHPAHPFLVPRSAYERQHYPAQLERVICFIGRCYAPHFSDHAGMDEDIQELSSFVGIDSTIPSIQALILRAIILHSLCNPDQALESITRAGVIARDLRVNHADLCASGAALLSVEAESLRRTWWELYTVDSYLAALHRRPAFACNPEDVCPLLPGSAPGNVDVLNVFPPSLHKFEGRFFSPMPTADVYSPYCYRIESVRILHRVLCLSIKHDSSIDAMEAADNAIASWKHYLPETGASFSSGEPSEAEALFFQAHCFIHTASILLHFPRSDLPAKISCAKDILCARNWTHGVRTSSQHTMKAVNASKEIANLAAIPLSVDFYSPLSTCALIIACMVQLAASSTHLGDPNDTHILRHRDRVVILLGVLSQLGRRWKTASYGAGVLRRVAERIFSKPSNDVQYGIDGVLPPDADEDWWSNLSWFDLFSASGLQANDLGEV